jgi:YbbR domain-containing protein
LALENTFDYKINLTIDYLNLPADKMLTNNLPKQFTVGVNAKGFDLMRYYFKSNKLPITVDLSKTNLKISPKQEKEFDVATTNFMPEIRKYMGDDIEINSIRPDTIKLYFSELLSKKVPVNLNVKVNCRKQYNTKGKPSISPDSVTVSGTKDELDSITSVNTVSEEYKEADKTIAEMINIEKKKQGNIFYSIEKVYVTIPIEKYTEKTLEIAIKILNLKPKYNIRIIPSKATLNFMIAVNDYKRATANDFNAVADFKDFDPANDSKIKVTLTLSPDYIKSMQITPPFVDYIIIK